MITSKDMEAFQINLLILASLMMLLNTLSRGLSPALPMGLDLTKNGMLPAWSTSLLRYGASVSTKNVSFLSPVQVSGKMTFPGGFKTLLAGLSSTRRVFSGVGHHPWGVPCRHGDASP